MNTKNISPEVKTGIGNIVSALKKHAEAAEEIKKTSSVKITETPVVDIFAPRSNTTEQIAKKRKHRYRKNPYAVAWPKDSPFYMPWHERIIKYLKFMFK